MWTTVFFCWTLKMQVKIGRKKKQHVDSHMWTALLECRITCDDLALFNATFLLYAFYVTCQYKSIICTYIFWHWQQGSNNILLDIAVVHSETWGITLNKERTHSKVIHPGALSWAPGPLLSGSNMTVAIWRGKASRRVGGNISCLEGKPGPFVNLCSWIHVAACS